MKSLYHRKLLEPLDNSVRFMMRGEYPKAYDQLRIGLRIAKRRRDKISIEAFLQRLGFLFYEMKKYSKATKYYTLAEGVSRVSPFSFLHSAEFYTFHYKRPFLALKKCNLALKKVEKYKINKSRGNISKEHLRAWCYALIGINYYRLRWYRKAFQILEKMISKKLYYGRGVQFASNMLDISYSREDSIKYLKSIRSWAEQRKLSDLLSFIEQTIKLASIDI